MQDQSMQDQSMQVATTCGVTFRRRGESRVVSAAADGNGDLRGVVAIGALAVLSQRLAANGSVRGDPDG
jgi:hypothetical protein